MSEPVVDRESAVHRPPPLRPVVVVESRIHAVTVYSEAARVTRRAEVLLPPGTSRVAILGLPAELEVAELRVRLDGGRLLLVEKDTYERPPGEVGDTRALERARVELESKERRLSAVLTSVEAELELIDRLEPAPPGPGLEIAPAPLRPDLFLAGLDRIERRRRDALVAIRELRWERHLARQELEELLRRERLRGQTQDAGELASAIVVTLEQGASGPRALELSYVLGWATWRPSYEIHVDSTRRVLRSVERAELWQETGEDWPSVQLTLSTAPLAEEVQPPHLDPWILGEERAFDDHLSLMYQERRPPPLPANAVRTGPADDFSAYADQFEAEGIFAEVTSAGVMRLRAREPFAGEESSSEERPSAAPLEGGPPSPSGRRRAVRRAPAPDHPDRVAIFAGPTPEVLAEGLEHERTVERPVRLASGLERARLSLATVEHPLAIEYLLRPAVVHHAFARARARHRADRPLLAGAATLFVDGAFFGQTKLAGTAAGGAISFDLGAEPGLRAERKSSTRFKTAGLLAKEDVHQVEVRLELESLLPAPVEALLEDQLPISQDERVEVRLKGSDPAGAELDPLTGVLRMKVQVAPGQRRTLSFQYQIVAPKDLQLEQLLED